MIDKSKQLATPIDVRERKRLDTLFSRISFIVDNARRRISRSVDSEMVEAYWKIGREIIEEEQQGQSRAGYGERIIGNLSERMIGRYGKGFAQANLKYMRRFYSAYPKLLGGQIGHAVRGQFGLENKLNPNLAWTHYRVLTKVESPKIRAFYEIEAVKNGWSSRELERQIDSLLFERLARSRDKKGVMRLALKGQEVRKPEDAIKDPIILEFLGLPESHKLVESKVEEALTDNLRLFLLELGMGFSFLDRQQRLTLDGDHFYVDLVFYHTILKAYILIDLKVGKLTHADIGQMQLYVNFYDQERRNTGDNPTIGLILCTNKNDAAVRYTLGKMGQRIFASRYKLHLPSEADLVNEIRRELRFMKVIKRRPSQSR